MICGSVSSSLVTEHGFDLCPHHYLGSVFDIDEAIASHKKKIREYLNKIRGLRAVRVTHGAKYSRWVDTRKITILIHTKDSKFGH